MSSSMCLTAFVVIVLVVTLPSIDASTKLTSAEVCQQIRSQEVSILTMGSRGHRNPHKHRFYLLTEFGYLFVVPFSNLKVDLQAKRAKLTIDTDYKDASQLYQETKSTFTTKPGKGAKQMFYLVTTIQNQSCLTREYGNSSHICYYFYRLDEGGEFDFKQWHCVEYVGKGKELEFAMSIDSNEHRIEQSVFFFKIEFRHGWYLTDTMEHNYENMDTESYHYVESLVKFPLKRPILTSFYVGVHGHNYTVLLSDNGRVIVGANKFEVSLSDFIECFPSNQPLNPPSTIYSTMDSSESPQSTIAQFPWSTVVRLVIIVVLCLCCFVALYFVIKKRKDKAKRKAALKASPNSSANSSTPTQSKFYTSIASIKTKISSLFQRNANSVAKANKKKGAKAKVAKKKEKDKAKK